MSKIVTMFILLWSLIINLCSSFALEMTRKEFCDSQALSKNEFSKSILKIEGRTPHPALLQTVIRLIEDFNIPGPFIFHFTDYVGPKKVWSLKLSTAHHIYFSKNAPDLLLGIELEKIEQEVCAPGSRGDKTFTINYTNTVIEQFLRNVATKESLASTLKKKTGWELRSLPGEKYYDDEQEFRTEELVTLIKQLMDIPQEIFKKMKIKKLTRWRYGAPLPEPDASAIYFVNEEKIIFSDSALMDQEKDVYGEGTILHEMGHAFWYGQSEQFKDKFSSISWSKNNGKWEKLASGSSGFISEYSMKSPDEDFAEHFSGYIHHPERLRSSAPKKNEFLEKHAFSDVSYFTTVAENAKIKIDSPTPDTKPPWLEKDFISSYRLDVKARNDQSKISDIYFEVNKAQDDLSGIAPALITLTHTQNKNYKIFIQTTPQKRPDGSFGLTASLISDPKKLAPGNYLLGTLPLSDMAGNTQYYESTGIPEVFIDGFMSLEDPSKQDIDVAKIRLDKLPPIDGYPGLKVTLPIPYEENFDSIHLTWEFPTLEGKTVHVCGLSRNFPCLMTERLGDQIVIHNYFHKQYPNSQVKLASLTINRKATENSAQDREYVTIPVNTPHLQTSIDTGKNYFDLIDLEVNQMKLKAVTKENKEGGNQNIEISIPLTNANAGKYYIMTTIRTPTGKSILDIVNENGVNKGYVLDEGGTKYLRFIVPLKKNPEDGIYMIESFRIKTEYPRHKNLPLDQNRLSEKTIKLIERGIKRTFTIKDDRFTELN
jgi:Putative zinc-binding metallo-peptidase